MESEILEKRKKQRYHKYIYILPIIVLIISIMVGRYFINLPMVLKALGSEFLNMSYNIPEDVKTVMFRIRLPRVIVAMLVGSALSLSGAAYQSMFRNPMVSPDILGASQGAAFGAALGILMDFGMLGIQMMSFAFGMFSVLATYFISRKIAKDSDQTLILVLSGLMIGTLFSSFISLIKYVADPLSKLPAITFWLMGSLTGITRSDVLLILIPFIVGAIPLMAIRWKMNVLSLGEEEAKALGINTKRTRFLVIICSTLMTSAAVSICGLVGWVGLVVPHISRMIVGPDMKKLMPMSLAIGSSYLLIVDNISRSLLSVEIPLGILTSIIGAPFFIYLLMNTRRGWS